MDPDQAKKLRIRIKDDYSNSSPLFYSMSVKMPTPSALNLYL